jgi:hypothetical protein
MFNDILQSERKVGYYMIHINLLLSLIIMICILILFIHYKYNTLWKYKNFIKINARLKKIYNTTTSTFFGMTYYNTKADITYVIGSKKYNTTTTFNLSTKPKVGDIGQILYNPSDPMKIFVTHQFTEMLMKLYSTIFLYTEFKASFVILLLNSIFYFYRNNKYLQTVFGLQIFLYLYRLLSKFMPSYPF